MYFDLLANKNKLNSEIAPYEKPTVDEMDEYINKTNSEHAKSERRSDDSHDHFRSEERSDHHSNYDKEDEDEKNFAKYEGFHNADALRLAKFELIKNLKQLIIEGIPITKNYTLDDSYTIMKCEYEMHVNIKKKQSAVDLFTDGLFNFCMGIEYLNKNYNPMNFNLNGWADSLRKDHVQYRDVMGELYDKHWKEGSGISPEMKLGMLLVYSAGKHHVVASKMEKLPEIDEDYFQQNPMQLEILKETIRRSEEATKAR